MLREASSACDVADAGVCSLRTLSHTSYIAESTLIARVDRLICRPRPGLAASRRAVGLAAPQEVGGAADGRQTLLMVRPSGTTFTTQPNHPDEGTYSAQYMGNQQMSDWRLTPSQGRSCYWLYCFTPSATIKHAING